MLNVIFFVVVVVISLQIRHRLGCYEEVVNVHSRQIRYCNWVRFLRVVAEMNEDVNIVANVIQGEIVFEVVSEVAAGVELVALFDKRDENSPSLPPVMSLQQNVSFLPYRNSMGSILEGEFLKKYIFQCLGIS